MNSSFNIGVSDRIWISKRKRFALNIVFETIVEIGNPLNLDVNCDLGIYNWILVRFYESDHEREHQFFAAYVIYIHMRDPN